MFLRSWLRIQIYPQKRLMIDVRTTVEDIESEELPRIDRIESEENASSGLAKLKPRAGVERILYSDLLRNLIEKRTERETTEFESKQETNLYGTALKQQVIANAHDKQRMIRDTQ